MKDGNKYAFIDIETTGSSPTTARITEVAVLVFDGEKVVDSLTTLINPEKSIPPQITGITGITDAMVAEAPLFEEIADQLYSIIEGCVFVAHNVRFDYGFIKNEFKRLDISFSAKTLCTVKLSRVLYPEHRRHGLDALMERFELRVQNRHRALDDSEMLIKLWDVWKEDKPQFEAVVEQLLKGPVLPKDLDPAVIESLPNHSGVYFFYGDDSGIPIYIGKSVDIKKRVLSHFSGDHISTKQARMVQQITQVKHVPTAGELGALLYESEQVKNHLPIYNRQLRRVKSMYSLLLKERGGYNEIAIVEINQADLLSSDKLFGCFKTQKQAKETLQEWVTQHGLCEKYLGLSKPDKQCFAHDLKRCSGACVNQVRVEQYNFLLLQNLSKLKLKNWYFKSAIAITEHCKDQKRKDVHFFDQWCYLGSVFNAQENELCELSSPRFDLDMYKILLRFLYKPRGVNTQIEEVNLSAITQ